MKKALAIILTLSFCLSSIALLASCGESAYDIAVKHGFEGTEQEWYESLKGEKGDKGDTGAAGEKGDTGAQGAKGDKGEQGAKGDTGAQGIQGAKGVQGEKGEAGYTPVRGVDYWTSDDIAKIKSYVDESILGGAW